MNKYVPVVSVLVIFIASLFIAMSLLTPSKSCYDNHNNHPRYIDCELVEWELDNEYTYGQWECKLTSFSPDTVCVSPVFKTSMYTCDADKFSMEECVLKMLNIRRLK